VGIGGGGITPIAEPPSHLYQDQSLDDTTLMTSDISPTNISQWLQARRGPLAMWAATIVVALILFFVTEGSSYHQLVMGLLASAIALCIALSLFEAAWQAVTAMLGVSAD
jgi:hypothetical protein